MPRRGSTDPLQNLSALHSDVINIDSDEQEIIEIDDSSQSSKEIIAAARSPAKRRAVYDSSDDKSSTEDKKPRAKRTKDVDDLVESEEEEKPVRKSPRKVARGRNNNKTAETEGSNNVATTKRTTRASSRNKDDDKNTNLLPKFLRKRKKNSDDEEFEPNDDDNDDSSIEGLSSIQSSDQSKMEELSSVDDKNVSFVGNVGDAEESSDDDNDTNLRLPPSPRLELRVRSRRLPSSSSSSSSSDDNSVSHNVTSPPRLVSCPSTHDVITDEELPRQHVCYFTPDKSSRQCFCLSTLRKIALTSTKFRNNDDTKISFLQPPHFRSNMSDDLLDQIASRFGRGALDINGPYYDEKTELADILGKDVIQIFENDNTTNFNEQVDRYVHSCMGSSDLYVCPLCYIVAHERCVNGTKFNSKTLQRSNNKSEESFRNQYSMEFAYDPMTVLGYLDKENYEIASTFCFKKAATCKVHLRDDHDVKTSLVKGNDLYARFKIRATDGLLQRWIKREFRQTKQGYLQRYWFDGNNYTFVQLLSLVHDMDDFRNIIATHADDSSESSSYANAVAFIQPAETFFKSFATIKDRLWDMVASPYGGGQQNDADFIDNGNEEEEEGSDDGDGYSDIRRADMEKLKQDVEEDRKYAKELERRYAEQAERMYTEDAGSDEYEGGRADDDDDVVEEVEDKITAYTSDEDSDEWLSNRAKRRRRTPIKN